MHPVRLSDLAPRYDAVLCDLWGVVHNGTRAFRPAVEALRSYRRGGGRVVLISNVPKTRGPIPGQLDRLGVPRDSYDGVVTSGDAVRAELAARAPSAMHLFGPPKDDELWRGLGLSLVEPEAAAFVCATGLEPAGEEPGHYKDRLERARARDLLFVCANPDQVVRYGERLIWCAGALAEHYQAIGGEVLQVGKPFGPIYELAFAELARLFGEPPERRRILAVGDGPGTDIRGANQQGLDSLFVGRGILADDFGSPTAFAAAAAQRLAERGVSATYHAWELT